jgi:zinc and cadmium transporter
MANIWLVILFSLVGGLFSLVGGILLLSSEKLAKTTKKWAAPFAAGALLAAAFVGLIPEAIHENPDDVEGILKWVLIGLLGFFLLERSIRYFHHHHEHGETDRKSVGHLIIIGDTVHNFMDGLAIAAGFLIDVPTGIATALAVAAHEVPQEIADFGLLLSKGFSRMSVVVINVLSSLATVVAAALLWSYGNDSGLNFGPVFGVTAGFFIYIAVSDIIPSIHNNKKRRTADIETMLLFIGVIVVALVIRVAEGH